MKGSACLLTYFAILMTLHVAENIDDIKFLNGTRRSNTTLITNETFGMDSFKEIEQINPPKIYQALHELNKSTSLCWSEILTLYPNETGNNIVIKEYEITLDYPYHENVSSHPDWEEFEEYNITDPVTQKSTLMNFTEVNRNGIILRQHRSRLCGAGPIFTKEYYEDPATGRKKITIRLSPSKDFVLQMNPNISTIQTTKEKSRQLKRDSSNIKNDSRNINTISNYYTYPTTVAPESEEALVSTNALNYDDVLGSSLDFTLEPPKNDPITTLSDILRPKPSVAQSNPQSRKSNKSPALHNSVMTKFNRNTTEKSPAYDVSNILQNIYNDSPLLSIFCNSKYKRIKYKSNINIVQKMMDRCNNTGSDHVDLTVKKDTEIEADNEK